MTRGGQHGPRSVWLPLLFATCGLFALLLPTGLGSYWGSHMIANAYLPRLGLASEAALVDPGSVRAYVALHAIIAELTGAAPRTVLNLIALSSAFTVFLQYVLLTRVLTPRTQAANVVSAYLPFLLFGQVAFLAGYILGPALVLSLAVFWCLVQLTKSLGNHVPCFIMLTMGWLALGLMWHSMQVATLLIACSFFIISRAHSTRASAPAHLGPVAFLVVVAGLTWLYMRPDLLAGALTSPLGHFDLAAILGRGNYAGPHAYASHSPLMWSSLARYVGYLAAYTLMGMMGLVLLRRLHNANKPGPLTLRLLVAVLCADVVFQSAYYFVTGSMAPGLLLFYGIPLALIAAAAQPAGAEGVCGGRVLTRFLLTIVVAGVVITAVDVQYRFRTEDVDHFCCLSQYSPSYEWSSSHIVEAQIFSDSATSGHYQVLSARSTGSSAPEACCIDRTIYERIAGPETTRPLPTIALNEAIEREHLAFGSLQSWNRFEPLDGDHISHRHGLSRIYTDGVISILIPETADSQI